VIDDQALEERFAALAAPMDGANWDDVRRRARQAGRKRLLGATIATLAAVAIATPAFGLQHAVIDWFQAEPAPEPVQLDFAQLGVGAPEGMDPGVILNSARKVMVAQREGKRHVLWVAPTRQGGFCYLWTGLTGGCLKDRVEPSVPGMFSADLHPFLVGASWSPDERGVVQWVDGRVLAAGVERLVAEYADGDRQEIPVVWVSPPIDAGFYVLWVPAEHRRVGHHLTAVVAESPDGEAIARQTFQLTPPELRLTAERLPDGRVVRLPAKAVVDEARRVIDFRAENGSRQTLWVMSATDGGQCVASNRWSGCFPKDVSPPPLATAVSGGETVLLQGRVRSDVAVIELRYQDGDVERIEPVEGFVLHEIPSRHYAPGTRLELEIAYDRDGRELGRHAMPADSRGVYPCDEPVDQGHGLLMCP
jgi:hypothetical protein